jgi:hypothetical protein
MPDLGLIPAQVSHIANLLGLRYLPLEDFYDQCANINFMTLFQNYQLLPILVSSKQHMYVCYDARVAHNVIHDVDKL